METILMYFNGYIVNCSAFILYNVAQQKRNLLRSEETLMVFKGIMLNERPFIQHA
jgi:hypothetical protein